MRRALGSIVVVAGLAVLAGGGLAASAAAPSPNRLPVISGRAQEGQVLHTSDGRWNGTKPFSFAYQWQRCSAGGSPCSNIGGAMSASYTITHDDVGSRLLVEVTAKNADGTASATSKLTDVVTAAAQAPVNTSPPSIGGTPKQGQVLMASAGSWSGSSPISFSYLWQVCDAAGGGCKDTSDHGQTYRLGSVDVGRTLRIVVTARNSAGTSAATSGPTAVIAGATAPAPPPPPPPAGSCRAVSTVSLPDQLVIDQVRFDPSQISSHDQPLIAHFHIVAAKGGCVSGALVYAVGVPFDRLSSQPETPTGGDGWATVTFRILPTFALKKGNLVVVFVRARKPGENVLAGVSARRLVSVRVG